MKKIKDTTGICNECDRVVPAEVIQEGDSIYLLIKCPSHGHNKTLHVWDKPQIYNLFVNHPYDPVSATKLVVNITNKCNLNCSYCYAKANEAPQKEFKLTDVDKLSGYKNIYLSGGEPTLRKDLFKLIKRLKDDRHFVGLLTNGIKLADKKYCDKLKEAGVDLVLLQFDSVNKEYNYSIRGYNDIPLKKKVLENLAECNLPVFPISIILNKQKESQLRQYLDFIFKYDNLLGVQFSPVIVSGRVKKEETLKVSGVIKMINRSIGIHDSNFIDSTRFLLNLGDFLMKYTKKKHFISKCTIYSILFNDNGKFYSINDLFEVKRLNSQFEKFLRKKKSNFLALIFIIQFTLEHIFINFIKNRYFRKFIKKIFWNLKYIFTNIKFVAPIKLIVIYVCRTKEQLDYDFVKSCNCLGTFDGKDIQSACIIRINTNKDIENSEKNNITNNKSRE